MKTQRQSTRLAIQDQRGVEQILQIDDATDCAGSSDPTCVKCDGQCQSQSISIILHSMINVSAEAWHAILYLITPLQYLPRLGLLFYILSYLCSISRRTKSNPRLQKPKLQKLELRKLKLNKQRHAGMRD